MNNLLITSRDNPQIKHVAKLKAGKHRRDLGEFIIEGKRELTRALEADIRLTNLFYCAEYLKLEKHSDWIEPFRKNTQNIYEVSQSVFDKISFRENPDGLIGTAATYKNELNTIPRTPESLLVILDGVEKPGNIGAILRTASASNTHGIILTNAQTDIFNPNIIRASQGQIFNIPIIVSTVSDCLKFLDERNCQVLITTPDGNKSYWDCDLKKPTAIVMGSEESGVSAEWENYKKKTAIRIPMSGKVDSLNVSVSTAVILYEASRQRSKT